MTKKWAPTAKPATRRAPSAAVSSSTITSHSSPSNRGLATLFRMAKDEEPCPKCKETLHRKAGSGHDPQVVPPIVYEVLSSPGQPLDRSVQLEMEDRFGGKDFSDVRIHTDSKAAESAHAVNAEAYTVGKDIAFAQGQDLSGSPVGNRVLIHELVHTLQQPARYVGSGLLRVDPNQSAEAGTLTHQLAAPVTHNPTPVTPTRGDTNLMRLPSSDTGGPYHPPAETETNCTALDDCASLSTKINYLRHTIRRHQEWDASHPDPKFPGGRHSEEIQNLQRAIENCKGFHNQKCSGQPTWIPVTAPETARKPVRNRDEVAERVKTGLRTLGYGLLVVAAIVGIILAAPYIAAVMTAISAYLTTIALGAAAVAAIMLVVQQAVSSDGLET